MMFLLFHQAKTYGQVSSQNSLLQTEISIKYSEETLYNILNDIQNKYKVNFYYSNNLIPLDYKLSIEVNKQPLYKVLDLLFKGTSIRYKIVDGQIVLIKEVKEIADKPDNSKPGSVVSVKKDSLNKKKENKPLSSSDINKGNMKNIREWKSSHKTIKTIKRNIGNKSNKDSTDTYSDTLSNQDKNLKVDKKPLNINPHLKTKIINHFSIDMNLAVGSSFRRLSSDNKEGNDVIKKRMNEKHKVAFISEIQCAYFFTNTISVSGGFGYMNLGEKGSYKDSSLYSTSYGYFTIPISGSYQYNLGKFSIKAGMGIIPAILLGKGNELQYDKLPKPPKLVISYRSSNMAYSFNAEAGYQIGKFTIAAGITYRQFFYSAFTKSSGLKEMNYLTAISAGLKYRL
jgi:hypothetical protein